MNPQDNNIPQFIIEAANRFHDHERMSVNRVKKWAAQFENEQNLAKKILINIKYYSGAIIKEAVEGLIDLACQHFEAERNELLYVPIGSPVEGSYVVARAIRGIEGIEESNFRFMSDLAKPTRTSRFKGMVLIDDFSGTGDSFSSWWEINETLIRPWRLPLIIGLLVLNYKANAALEKIPAELIYIDYLDLNDNVLLNDSNIFTQGEKQLLEHFCRKTRCRQMLLKGWSECGLLLAFRHGCPNNSLPILWYNKRRWQKLFNRRAF
ncbi:MAG: hypothetical protein KAT65_03895 [Methanophagales archaeon]|nr:hypothetical protein [Methanophagales archaeon]